jgi:hypothetical protein
VIGTAGFGIATFAGIPYAAGLLTQAVAPGPPGSIPGVPLGLLGSSSMTPWILSI